MRTRHLFILLTFAVLISTAALLAADKNKSKKSAAANGPAQMDDDKRMLHALNRFTFGPRPGDVEKVR
ncbi:MAG TPA: hypothetical protein VG488_10530, partial [Candidatus Angelobacter sp.]|nr:hypothetical protein [Candidatus Angelobacter sp.]